MRTKINFGEAFRLPLATRKSICDRIILSNPAVRKSYFSELKSIKRLRKSIPEACDHFYYPDFTLLTHYLAFLERCKISFPHFAFNETYEEESLLTEFKSCYICWAYAYHSPLYHLNWIQYCPFHRTRLLPRCPYCKQEYKTLERSSYSCKECSPRLTYLERIKLKKSYAPEQVYNWTKLERLILKEQSTPLDHKFLLYDIFSRGEMTKFRPSNQYYINFLLEKYQGLKSVIDSLSIEVEDCKISKATLNSISPNRSEYKLNYQFKKMETLSTYKVHQTISKPFYNARLIALKYISNKANEILAECKLSLTTYESAYFKELPKTICPYSYALTCWLDCVTYRNRGSRLPFSYYSKGKLNDNYDAESVKPLDSILFNDDFRSIVLLNEKQIFKLSLFHLLNLYRCYCTYFIYELSKIINPSRSPVCTYLSKAKTQKCLELMSSFFAIKGAGHCSIFLPKQSYLSKFKLPSYPYLKYVEKEQCNNSHLIFGLTPQQIEGLKLIKSVELDRVISKRLEELSLCQIVFDKKIFIENCEEQYQKTYAVQTPFEGMEISHQLGLLR